MLRGKNILVGVTGSIAAYKSAILIRSLVKEGADVKIIMTPAATEFISPLTLSTLSKNPVSQNFFDTKSGEWTSHVDLGLWADLYIIAPATANTIAKFANGICEDLLAAVYLSARCPVFIAPAMDLDMYRHSSTTNNITTLKNFGNSIIDAGHGELASGLVGAGRMAEPEKIVQIVEAFFGTDLPLTGKNVLVTAGPTHEAIDPVRFIGNHSSGKMGYAIAEELAEKGANVKLVSGPSQLNTHHTSISKHDVNTADNMYRESHKDFASTDIIVLAAAVADYKPVEKATEKIKKQDASMSLELTKTVDIAAAFGKEKKEGQFIVGFALETENAVANALVKVEKKNFDLIVLNSLKDKGAGFGHDTNKVTIIDNLGVQKNFELKSKKEVARDIVNEIIERIHV
jgi:phosphopantothenoylcysteine decarboxylase/phosphopantothenate--cysteine ligase